MTKIVPFLWFDTQALEAVQTYLRLFEDSEVYTQLEFGDTPSGTVQTIDFRLANLQIGAMNAGPFFKLNPSMSFFVHCTSNDEVDKLYLELSKQGEILMPLGQYDFNPYYVWLTDRFGVSWQLFVDPTNPTEKIVPSLLFAGKYCGMASPALKFYREVFAGSTAHNLAPYLEGQASDERAEISYVELKVFDQTLILMDHGAGGTEEFTEAFSLMLLCEDQSEIDYYWERLSKVPEAEACGWCKDPFGVSWQIVPHELNDWMATLTDEQRDKVNQKLMPMKKIEIFELKSI